MRCGHPLPLPVTAPVCHRASPPSGTDWRLQDCAAQLLSIYSTYYGPPAGTICQTAIQASLTESDPANCPPSNVTIPCFNVRPKLHGSRLPISSTSCHTSSVASLALIHLAPCRCLTHPLDVCAASTDPVDGLREHLRRVLLVRLQSGSGHFAGNHAGQRHWRRQLSQHRGHHHNPQQQLSQQCRGRRGAAAAAPDHVRPVWVRVWAERQDIWLNRGPRGVPGSRGGCEAAV